MDHSHNITSMRNVSHYYKTAFHNFHDNILNYVLLLHGLTKCMLCSPTLFLTLSTCTMISNRNAWVVPHIAKIFPSNCVFILWRGINMDAKPKAIRDYGVIFELHVLLPVDYKRKESVVLPYHIMLLFLLSFCNFPQQSCKD